LKENSDMKKLPCRVFCLVLAVMMLLSAVPAAALDETAPASQSPAVSEEPTAAAPEAEYADAAGHWAEKALLRAAGDGYLTASGGKLYPNAPIDRAQAAAVINRVLKAAEKAELGAGSDISAGAWYRDDLEKAMYLGYLNTALTAVMKRPLTRGETFLIFARAFGLSEAKPDYTVLSAYSDASSLTGEIRSACASIVSSGLAGGAGGKLMPAKTVTRAEFVTILYRLLDGFSLTDCASADAVLPDDGGSAVIRSSALKTLTAKGVYKTVSFCQSSGDAVFSAAADKIIIYTSGAVTVSGRTGTVQAVGAGRRVTVKGAASSLCADGAGDEITVAQGAAIDTLELLPGASGAKLVINGTVKNLVIAAENCAVTGTGRVEAAEITGAGCSASVRSGMSAFTPKFQLTAPTSLPAGETLTVSAAFSASYAGKGCTLQWYADGAAISGARTENYAVSRETPAEYSPKITYVKNLPEKITVGLGVTYCSGGELEHVYASADTALENYPAEHYRVTERARVNALVTSYKFAAVTLYNGYLYTDASLRTRSVWVQKGTSVTCVSSVGCSAVQVKLWDGRTGWTGYNSVQRGSGNYTRPADYDAGDKEIWVAMKGYTSPTKYLVWVSLDCQRVNVFENAGGSWKLIHAFACASGKNSTPTPTGTYKISYKQDRWSYTGYWCGPVTGFNGSYAFHSWLTNNDGSAHDHTMGRPASHGCIRMEDAGAQYMHTLPIGTTVIVY
jgi:lipoprotein-anchoring transpeptidase ErfK/SrfK